MGEDLLNFILSSFSAAFVLATLHSLLIAFLSLILTFVFVFLSEAISSCGTGVHKTVHTFLMSFDALPNSVFSAILAYTVFSSHLQTSYLPALASVVLCLAVVFAPGMWIWLNAQKIQFQKEEYIKSSYALGATDWMVFQRHFLIYIAPSLALKSQWIFVQMIYLEGFLGLVGSSLPLQFKTLGAMTREAWLSMSYDSSGLAWIIFGYGVVAILAESVFGSKFFGAKKTANLGQQ